MGRTDDRRSRDGRPCHGSDPGREFALVARDLVGERPLEAIPLAARIAAATVEAFEQR